MTPDRAARDEGEPSLRPRKADFVCESGCGAYTEKHARGHSRMFGHTLVDKRVDNKSTHVLGS